MTSSVGRLYFALQFLAGALWWVGVFTIPFIRETTLGSLNPVLVAAFDIPLFVVASGLAACGLRWAVWIVVPWTLIVALAMSVYATITAEAGPGAVLMLASAGAGVFAGCLVILGRVPSERLIVGPFAFRSARASTAESSSTSPLARTGLQLLVFWGFFLVLLPALIVWFEARWGLSLELPTSLDTFVRVSGLVLLIPASALGIWSATAMATFGAGTPLPSDMANHLVVRGPYRFVRNPMAVAGIAQGVSVGLLIGSWAVVVYALSGSLIWNWLIRPHEEADLRERFGAEFNDYAQNVSCWILLRTRAHQHSADSALH